jgi:hypothetical protein
MISVEGEEVLVVEKRWVTTEVHWRSFEPIPDPLPPKIGEDEEVWLVASHIVEGSDYLRRLFDWEIKRWLTEEEEALTPPSTEQ